MPFFMGPSKKFTSGKGRLQVFQGAWHPVTTLVENMGIYHGGGDIFVPKQGLNRSDIRSFLKKMGCKAMTIMGSSP